VREASRVAVVPTLVNPVASLRFSYENLVGSRRGGVAVALSGTGECGRGPASVVVRLCGYRKIL